MRIHHLLAVLLVACAPAAWAQVRVWQDTLTLPAYEEGLPDPNPPFDQFASTRFNYPYTLRNNLTNRRMDHNWRAIYLENECLKCSVLPDIGGHLYTCIDKISGKPMFYANPSIKKADIGYRGAWAAFGIEFNFPVSHNWVSMSPVDFAFGKHGTFQVLIFQIDGAPVMVHPAIRQVVSQGIRIVEAGAGELIERRIWIRQSFFVGGQRKRILPDSYLRPSCRCASDQKNRKQVVDSHQVAIRRCRAAFS